MTTKTSKILRVGDKVTLGRTTYVIDRVTTTEDHEAEGRANLARVFRESGVHSDLVIRRPNGSKLHLARQGNGRAWYVTAI